MKKHIKLFFIFTLMIFLFMLVTTYSEYKNINAIKHLVALEESASLSKFIKSFRKVYLEAFIEHEIEVTDKTLNLLPVKTLPIIAKEFESLLGGNVSIRTVSDRPRNPDNKVNDFENTVIKYFKKNRDKKFYVTHKDESSHSYFVPLYIEESCLKCHGKKENAIEAIRVRYDKAYDYKLADLRGMIHLRITDKQAFDKLDDAFNRGLLTKFGIFIIMISLLYYLINTIRKNELAYTTKLERKVNEQVSELRKKDEILNTQTKMAAMGEMLENIAHQWRQPLSAISSASSGIKIQKEFGEVSDEELNKSLDAITKSAKFLSSTIDDFRDFFKSDKQKYFFSVKKSYDQALIIIESKFKNEEIEIISDIDDIKVFGVHNELVQVLMNILNNAKDALLESPNERKLILVSIKQVKDRVQILIKDNANGIPEEIINKVFEPYFTTKYKSQGTGIGLYMSQEIVSKQFDGVLLVENCNYVYDEVKYTGAQFEINLPYESKTN